MNGKVIIYWKGTPVLVVERFRIRRPDMREWDVVARRVWAALGR